MYFRLCPTCRTPLEDNTSVSVTAASEPFVTVVDTDYSVSDNHTEKHDDTDDDFGEEEEDLHRNDENRDNENRDYEYRDEEEEEKMKREELTEYRQFLGLPRLYLEEDILKFPNSTF